MESKEPASNIEFGINRRDALATLAGVGIGELKNWFSPETNILKKLGEIGSRDPEKIIHNVLIDGSEFYRQNPQLLAVLNDWYKTMVRHGEIPKNTKERASTLVTVANFFANVSRSPEILKMMSDAHVASRVKPESGPKSFKVGPKESY